MTTTTTTTCPSCGRPAVGLAFYTTSDYLRDSVGHVFPATTQEDQS